jgi:hypothetical protein
MVCVKDVMRMEVMTNKTKPMVRDFKFFNTGSNVIPQPRLPRTPIAHIPVPPYTNSVNEYRRAFINGWRAYEFGRNIYDCPHSSYDPIEIPLKREWEYGFTECHNSRQIPVPLPTDEDCYLEGWSTAQVGFPLNENPHPIGSHQSSMWDCGWNDFINEH